MRNQDRRLAASEWNRGTNSWGLKLRAAQQFMEFSATSSGGESINVREISLISENVLNSVSGVSKVNDGNTRELVNYVSG